MQNSIWKKFYPCSCDGEGIAMSYEQDDEILCKYVDLGYYSFDILGKGRLSLLFRLRYCWRVLTRGYPYNDMVMITQKTAGELGKDLVKFSKRKFNNKR